MLCPICYHKDTKVINSRNSGDGFCIRRRRECDKCGFRFSTYEELEILDLTVIKKDGAREVYNRDKVKKGLNVALEKRNIKDEKIKKAIHLIERDLQKKNKTEIPSIEIGKIVMRHLKKIDKIAYIRFASVYESFEDAHVFREELNKLLRIKK